MGHLLRELADLSDQIVAHMEEKSPDMVWLSEIQQTYWHMAADAHDNGKKLIYVGAGAPCELIWAMDNVVPFLVDMLPTRLGSDPEKAAKYIDEAEKHVAASMCAIDKVDLGAVLSGDMPDIPDGFVWSTLPCDSSRVAYPAIQDYLMDHGMKTSLKVDMPFRKDQRGYTYLANQYKDMVPQLEALAGHKLDWDKFEEVMKISDETNTLMSKIADLRKLKPCPLPGRLLVLNEMIPAMAGHPAMLEFLEMQYALGSMLVDEGMTATKCEEENFRVTWLQNMLWSNVSTMDWLEGKYGATVVMDAFGYQKTFLFDDHKDQDRVFYNLAQKSLAVPMLHGAAGPVEDYVDLVDHIIDEYSVDVSMYVGHVGCKHTWAVGKVVKDFVQDKYGLPTLTIDVDAVDGRYKSKEEIREVIGEYMDNLVDLKKKGDYPPPRPAK